MQHSTLLDPEFFRLLVERVREYAIYGLDPEGHVASWNEGAERIKGYTADEVLGRSFELFFPPEEVKRGTPARLLREAEANGQVEQEGWRVRKDGTRFWADAVLTVLRDDAGRLVGFAKITRDLTERERLRRGERELVEERMGRRAERKERELAQQLARQEAALRNAAHALAAASTVEDVIQEIAQSALEAAEADGAFVKRIDAERNEVVVVAVAGEGTPKVGLRLPYRGSVTENVIESKGPVVIRPGASLSFSDALTRSCPGCSILVVPLRDAGEAMGTLALLRGTDDFPDEDMDRALAFADLGSLALRKIHLLDDSERRREELERVMESRSRLMRGFSHDVRNPLSAADGYLDLIETGIVKEEQKRIEFMGRARRALSSAMRLLDDLLELSQAEAGHIEVKPGPVDLRDIVSEITTEYRGQAFAKGLTLECNLPGKLPVVRTDATRVRQILGNLISNAIKYTQDGRVQVALAVAELGSGPKEGEWLRISVADTGTGIAREDRELLFREFSRLDPDAAEGAGLGLAISQRVAGALGGEIAVESEFGAGSTFTLWLPLGGLGED